MGLHHHAETQRYVYDTSSQNSNAPRIPKVHDRFYHGIIMYLVMEYIPMLSRKDAASTWCEYWTSGRRIYLSQPISGMICATAVLL